MNVLKIGVVEDELIIANTIIRMLTEIGYHTTDAAISYSEAIGMLHEEKPDLLLLDINLCSKKDGIDVAAYINTKQPTPFIFLTANSDLTTLERAKRVNPNAYLIKPFTKEDLYVSIEVAFNNYNTAQQAVPAALVPAVQRADQPVRHSVFIRSKQAFVRVSFSDVLFAEGGGNYLTLHLENGDKLLHRSTLADFAATLPASQFIRVHRSYLVRTQAIEKVEGNQLIIGCYVIPIGKERIDEVLHTLGINS